MGNRVWQYYFGDVAEFFRVIGRWLAIAWDFITNQIGQGTLGRTLADAWDYVVLGVAKAAGKPQTADLETQIMVTLFALFLLGLLIGRADYKKHVGKPVSASAIVMWTGISVAIGVSAWTANAFLVALSIMSSGGLMAQIIAFGKAFVTGTKKRAFWAFIGLLFSFGFFCLFFRALYVATLLY